MDKLTQYRDIIEGMLSRYADIPCIGSTADTLKIFDRIHDHYLLLLNGFDNNRRVHGCLIHLDIIDGKCWLQLDNTDAVIAEELEYLGVPKEDIVIGFQPQNLRHHTGYAVA